MTGSDALLREALERDQANTDIDLRDLLRHTFAALDATNEPEPLDVNALADDVRYSGGNGTGDYWRGFNDGIDKLAARVSASVDREEPA